MAEWGATPDGGGCPELEDPPAVGMGLSMSLITGGRHRRPTGRGGKRRGGPARRRGSGTSRLISADACRTSGPPAGSGRVRGDDLADYAVRSETRHEHLAELRRLYGFRSFSGGAARELVQRLREEAEQAEPPRAVEGP